MFLRGTIEQHQGRVVKKVGSRIFESGNAQQMTKLSKYVFLSLNHFNGTYDARIRRENIASSYNKIKT